MDPGGLLHRIQGQSVVANRHPEHRAHHHLRLPLTARAGCAEPYKEEVEPAGGDLPKAKPAEFGDDHLREDALVLVDRGGLDPTFVAEELQPQRRQLGDRGVGSDRLPCGCRAIGQLLTERAFSRGLRCAGGRDLPSHSVLVPDPSARPVRTLTHLLCPDRAPGAQRRRRASASHVDTMPQRGRLARDSETPSPALGSGTVGTSSKSSTCSAIQASRSDRR